MSAYARRLGYRAETLLADEAGYLVAGGDWDAVLRLAQETRGETVWTAQLQVAEAFILAGREGPARSLPLLEVPRRVLRDVSASHKLFLASTLGRVTLLAGDPRATLDHLDGLAAGVGAGLFPAPGRGGARVPTLGAAVTR